MFQKWYVELNVSKYTEEEFDCKKDLKVFADKLLDALNYLEKQGYNTPNIQIRRSEAVEVTKIFSEYKL